MGLRASKFGRSRRLKYVVLTQIFSDLLRIATNNVMIKNIPQGLLSSIYSVHYSQSLVDSTSYDTVKALLNEVNINEI